MGGPRAGPGAGVAGRVGRKLGGGDVFKGFELMCAMQEALVALFDDLKAARTAGTPEEKLAAALKLERRAEFRVDFINAENSTGFHAPQEAARPRRSHRLCPPGAVGGGEGSRPLRLGGSV